MSAIVGTIGNFIKEPMEVVRQPSFFFVGVVTGRIVYGRTGLL
jgi:hypothetical protein